MVEHDIAPIGVDLYTPDLVGIARAYGCLADRARDHAHLAELLTEARSQNRPTLIEVVAEGPFVSS